MSERRIDLINGPNLNLLGRREPDAYGRVTLADIVDAVRAAAHARGVSAVDVQSNSEGALVDHVHAAAAAGSLGCVINPGAYTHTSVALRDAFAGTRLPFVEVHISNVYAREEFRHRSVLRDLALGVIVGLGADGYLYGLDALLKRTTPP